MSRELPRRFHLLRIEDVNGMSGEGVVAEGVEFSNGFAALTWLTHLPCVTVYTSVSIIEKIHGHEGKTVLRYDDEKHEKAEEVGANLAE